MQSTNRAMDRRVLAQLFDSIDLLSLEPIAKNEQSTTITEIRSDSSQNFVDESHTDGDTPPMGRVVLIVATNK